MDAILILLAFAIMIALTWLLGAKGLAVLLLGCAIATTAVELWWHLKYRTTVSKEMGALYRRSRIRFWIVCGLLAAGTVGLLAHFIAMGR